MATIYYSHFDQLTKTFREIPNAIEDIIKNSDDVKQKASVKLAEEVIHTIEQKYSDYINSVSDLEHGTKNVTTSIRETKKGCSVKISGKDIIYQEYGTGTRGLKNSHPRHDADGMKPYGSGRTIVHHDMRNTGHNPPRWYVLMRDFPNRSSYGGGLSSRMTVNDFNNEPIRKSDYVWKHNGIITKGLPAGRFIYDTIKEYKDDGEIKSHTKKILKTTIKEDLTPRMHRKVKEIANKAYNSKSETIVEMKQEQERLQREVAQKIFRQKFMAALNKK